MHQIKLLCNEPENIIQTIKTLLHTQHEMGLLEKKYQTLQEETGLVTQKAHQYVELEKEVIKLRAYIEGLKQTNQLTSRSTD